MELAPENVPQLPASRDNSVPSGKQSVEGTTFQISCPRHGNLIAWAWTPGDPRQQADLANLFMLLRLHEHSKIFGGCNIRFDAKAIKNV